MALGTIFYGLFMLSGAFTAYCSHGSKDIFYCSKTAVYSMNLISSVLLGTFGATLLWTGQYVYISRLSNEDGKLFALFYSVVHFNQISGNLFNYVFYSYSPNIVLYFIIFVMICFTSMLLFSFLPNKVGNKKSLKNLVLKNDEKGEENNKLQLDESSSEDLVSSSGETDCDLSRKKEGEKMEVKDKSIKTVFKTMFSKEVLNVTPFMLISGILVGTVSTFLYKITSKTCQNEAEVEINKKISLTMMVYGLCGAFMSQILQRVLEKLNLKPLIILSCLVFSFTIWTMSYVWNHPNYKLAFIVRIKKIKFFLSQ